MKVLKFGGTSVGSVESIRSVQAIVASQEEPVIVVVSALGGVTDALQETAVQAMSGRETTEESYRRIVERHRLVMNGLGVSKEVVEKVEVLLAELGKLYRDISECGAMSPEKKDLVLSFGERMSSLIVADVLLAEYMYSPDFIKTREVGGRHVLDMQATSSLVKTHFGNQSAGVMLVPGFIATDAETGDMTNLGRGGSDYTAAILAAELGARQLEIWTDVDGFMTADPRIISKAYVIDRLSYVEAMELCNFGAKVIYPPTIFPVYHKNIPILIKNTFNPSSPGTYISRDRESEGNSIKGISSINDTALVSMLGMGMVGVTGVSKRLYGALADAGISVFFISQAASENTITIGVKNSEADRAVELIREEFFHELQTGEINEVKAEKELATVAVVGDRMKRIPGISGKLFGTMGRSGINVIAIAQGASETNISFVIQKEQLRKTLNLIHESFFLSEYQELNVFLCGIGTVGGGLLDQLLQQQELLMRQNRLKIKVVGIASSRKMIFDREGIDLRTFRDRLETEGVSSTPELLLQGVLEMNIYNSVFVDCTASAAIAEIYKSLLTNNVSVVAANKIAASSSYEQYADLKEISRKKGIKFLFETNVGAGLPIINTINDLINSGDRITRIEAVLSGTLNYIFNTLSADVPFSQTIRMAKDAGYAEPDPRIDLSGKDVVRKLVILAREAGYRVEQEDVEKNLFVPNRYFDGSLEDFWSTISELDEDFESRRRKLEREHKKYRFVAMMDEGKCSVGLQEVDTCHPFYDLEGSNNIIMITTERYKEYPMIIKGYGAGASVTAAGVFSDIISIANIR
ncbi:MAG: bifunctional aspartate kinase/homoserine dehydrogenase I [Paludibacteraceae bacterium]|nr:bifunctional aspartate kinase/homoserine dehydrogenase I [Paludibacteraceae bacterium]